MGDFALQGCGGQELSLRRPAGAEAISVERSHKASCALSTEIASSRRVLLAVLAMTGARNDRVVDAASRSGKTG